MILGAPAAEEPVAPWAPGSCPARLLEALLALDARREDAALPSVGDVRESRAPFSHVALPERRCEAAALVVQVTTWPRSEEVWEGVRGPHPGLHDRVVRRSDWDVPVHRGRRPIDVAHAGRRR